VSFFFPEVPRAFPGRRGLKILLRATHVLCAGILVGGYVFGGDAGPWLWATIVSGLAILLLDLHESAAFLLQLRGLIVVGKIATVGALPWFHGSEVWVFGALVVVSVLSSHAPASFRHRVVIGAGRIRGPVSRG